MDNLWPANSRPTAIVDGAGRALADPSSNLIGMSKPFWGERLVWASWLNGAQVTQRYQPAHPPEEGCAFGMDFSMVCPFGVQLISGSLAIFQNLASPAPADADWVKGPVTIRGRAVYAQLTGGIAGTDYQLRWTVADNQGNVWPRTALCLCAETS